MSIFLFIIFIFIPIFRCDPSRIVVRDKDPSPGFFPNLGNGMISFDMGCPNNNADSSGTAGSFSVAGIYNGLLKKGPSKRAVIPGVYSYTLAENDVQSWEAILDFEKGLFTNTSSLSPAVCGDNNGATLTMEWIVHRKYKDLMIFSVFLEGESEVECEIKLVDCNSKHSSDVHLVKEEYQKVVEDDEMIRSREYSTNVEEIPGVSDLSTIFIEEMVVSQQSLSFSDQQQSHHFLAKIHSSSSFNLDKHGKYKNDNLPSYYFQKGDKVKVEMVEYEKLKREHIESWGEVWESGIEVIDSKINNNNNSSYSTALAINASLFYLYNSLDSSVPWSISPGGLARSSYSGHVFWDCETWIFPTFSLLNQPIAKALLAYRTARFHFFFLHLLLCIVTLSCLIKLID